VDPRQIIAAVRAAGRHVLLEDEAKSVLSHMGLPVNLCALAASEEEAVAAAETLGYPVAVKVRSPAVIHKSDAGGVWLGLGHAEAVRRAYREMAARWGQVAVTVQPMAAPGVEVIAGVAQDPQFGPVAMFGLGGIFTEVLRDVAFRMIPLEPKDARAMITQIRGYRLLAGYRGRRGVDLTALEEILLGLSELVEKIPDVREVDLNPIIAYPDGALIVDARITIA